MNYLLDTNVLIDFFHGQKNIVDKVQSIERENLSISIITAAEIYHGSYKTALSRKYIDEFENFLIDLEVLLIPLDRELVKRYGLLMASLEKQGKKLSSFDILIAATALIHNLTIITNDKGLARIKGLKIENL